MAASDYTWFDQALLKIADGTIDLSGPDFKAVLCGDVQGIGANFAGASTDCRYADLTDELPTANGYTAGGFLLPTPTFSRTGNVVTFSADPAQWTLTGSIFVKYVVYYDDSAANKDLICFVDIAVGGPELFIAAGLFQITPPITGMLGWDT